MIGIVSIFTSAHYHDFEVLIFAFSAIFFFVNLKDIWLIDNTKIFVLHLTEGILFTFSKLHRLSMDNKDCLACIVTDSLWTAEQRDPYHFILLPHGEGQKERASYLQVLQDKDLLKRWQLFKRTLKH